MARRSIRPWQTKAVYDALLGGFGVDEAARAGHVSPQTVLRMMAVGPSCPAPGLPRNLPLLLVIDRVRRGVSIADPLSDAESVIASQLMLSTLAAFSRKFERLAAQLAPTVAKAPTPSAAKGAT
jgi:hypothetical protein